MSRRLPQSAWLAKRIRKSRQRRSRTATGVVVATLLLLVVPPVLRFPVVDNGTTTTTTILRVKPSAQDASVAIPTTMECPSATEHQPEILKGSGEYHLDHPRGIQTTTDDNDNNEHNDDNDRRSLSWSQYGQDVWIDTYLGHQQNGLFLEVGGYDGETHSNTLFFETQRAWQGLLIEANPYSFDVMKTKGRACWMAHACIQHQNNNNNSTNNNSTNNNHLHFHIAGGITSAWEVTSESHVQRIQHDMPRYREQANWKGAGQTVCLPCTPWVDLLHQTLLFDNNTATSSAFSSHNNNNNNNALTIDYVSLDVEGAELDVLQALLGKNDSDDDDVPNVTIRLFTIEMQENAHAIRRFLRTKHYQEIATIGIDSVFVLQQQQQQHASNPGVAAAA